MKARIIAAILVLAALLIAGCQTALTQNETTPLNFTDINVSENISTPENNTVVNQTIENQTIDESKASFTIDAVEGDLVKIPLKAVDPDGDFLEYKFEKPFNDKGLWQTKIGDEGKYLTKVTVSDGSLSTSEYVLVNIARANRPPTIECPDTIKVQKTETVVIDCNIFDVDGDVVLTGYDGWMNSATYKTTYGDAGNHTVIVRAKDKTHETNKEITIIVTKKDRAPVIEDVAPIIAIETDTINIDPIISDPDGDNVTVTLASHLTTMECGRQRLEMQENTTLQ